VFIGLMVAIAVLCSWVGALCWNIASQKLPTVILGPLIVFETLAGLLYTFLMRQSVPPLFTACGIALLVVGVVMAVSEAGKTEGRSGVGDVKTFPSYASDAAATGCAFGT
jgi:drug/metabolite transporter (DMT)-like permease